MAARGHRVMAVAPRYACYEEGWETGVRLEVDVFHSRHQVGFFHGFVGGVDVVFVDHPCFSNRHGSEIYAGEFFLFLFFWKKGSEREGDKKKREKEKKLTFLSFFGLFFSSLSFSLSLSPFQKQQTKN